MAWRAFVKLLANCEDDVSTICNALPKTNRYLKIDRTLITYQFYGRSTKKLNITPSQAIANKIAHIGTISFQIYFYNETLDSFIEQSGYFNGKDVCVYSIQEKHVYDWACAAYNLATTYNVNNNPRIISDAIETVYLMLKVKSIDLGTFDTYIFNAISRSNQTNGYITKKHLNDPQFVKNLYEKYFGKLV